MPGGLWRDRTFVLFLVIQTASFAGDTFTTVALPLLVLQATGSVVQMGLLTGTIGLAWLVTGVFAGAVVDGFDRRVIMIGCDVARAVLYGVVPLVWLVDPQLWVLYAVMPFGAAVGMLSQVTYVTAIPSLVGRDRLTEANGAMNASSAAAGVGGPLLAGIVAGLLGPAAAIGIDAVTFALAAVGMLFVRLRRMQEPSRTPAGRAVPWRGVAVGARFLWQHPALRTLTLLLGGVLFVTYGLTDVFIYRIRHDLDQPSSVVGIVLAVAAVGTILSGIAVAALRRRLGFGACWIGSYAVAGLAIVLLGRTAALPLLAALVAVFVFCEGVAGTCSMSLRQQVTPDALLGRVTSAFWTLHFLPGPAGAVLLTAAVKAYGVPAATLVAGVGLLLIAGVATFSPIRDREPGRAVPTALPAPSRS
jgi:MFS family permease